jgi:signal transduction histidine kinase
MTSSEPQTFPPGDRQLGDVPGVPGVLAEAARTLGQLPPDASDAALLAALSQAIVPALGDVVALYAVDSVANVRLIEAAPGAAPAAGRLQEYVEPRPAAAAEYAALVDAGSPPVVLPGEAKVGRALRQAVGLTAEIVAPLGDAATRDGLLVISSADAARRYDAADRSAAEVLAALVGARRAARRQAERQAERQATQAQQIETLATAGRELAHAINNDLTMPVGVIELLQDRTSFSPDLQEMLQAAAKDLASLEQHVREFHELLRAQQSRAAQH